MTTLQKLSQYKERLTKWKQAKADGHHDPEPQPQDFKLNNAIEDFMAKKTREEVVGR